LQYPKLSLNLFSIPNGGRREIASGRWYVAEGLTRGVADCFLAVPSGELHGAFIEFKSKVGRQTAAQRDFQLSVFRYDYCYWIVKDIEQFIVLIKNYLQKV